MDPKNIKFMVQAVYNVLPGPANLQVSGKTGAPAWKKFPGVHPQQLSNSPGYRLQHDQVLKPVAMANIKHMRSKPISPLSGMESSLGQNPVQQPVCYGLRAASGLGEAAQVRPHYNNFAEASCSGNIILVHSRCS